MDDDDDDIVDDDDIEDLDEPDLLAGDAADDDVDDDDDPVAALAAQLPDLAPAARDGDADDEDGLLADVADVLGGEGGLGGLGVLDAAVAAADPASAAPAAAAAAASSSVMPIVGPHAAWGTRLSRTATQHALKHLNPPPSPSCHSRSPLRTPRPCASAWASVIQVDADDALPKRARVSTEGAIAASDRPSAACTDFSTTRLPACIKKWSNALSKRGT